MMNPAFPEGNALKLLAQDADLFRMNRALSMAVVAVLLAFAAPLAADPADDSLPAPPPPPPPQITFFNGSEWVPLAQHSIYVTGAGATVSGTATATLKSKLDGPKTYVVLAGTTSEVALANPKPRFRIASDRTGAHRVQLAQFEPDDTVRSTTIERVRNGVFFSKSVDLEVMEIAEGLWELRPTKSLQPGEYGLATTDTDPVADFTVIEKGY